MKMQKIPGGLVIPVQKKKEDTRKYNSFEIQNEEDRKEASKAFHILRNLPEVRGALLCRSRKDAEVLDNLITSLARILLGNDWDCEVYC